MLQKQADTLLHGVVLHASIRDDDTLQVPEQHAAAHPDLVLLPPVHLCIMRLTNLCI